MSMWLHSGFSVENGFQRGTVEAGRPLGKSVQNQAKEYAGQTGPQVVAERIEKSDI